MEGLELMLFLGGRSREDPASLILGVVWGGRPGGETHGERTTEKTWEGRKVQERYEDISCGVNRCDRILFPSVPFQRFSKADTAH